MGDGIGGPVISCLSGNTFEMSVTHFRKDNKEQYEKIERITIAKVDDPNNPQYGEKSVDDLIRALKGKFVTCNVQYRDSKTDMLVCNVFVQNPPEGFQNISEHLNHKSEQLDQMLEQLTNFVAGAEWVWIIVIAVVLLFGAKKIPELAKTFGKAKGEYEKGRIEGDKELKEFKEERKSDSD